MITSAPKFIGGGYEHLIEVIKRQDKRREIGVPIDCNLLISVGELSVRKNHKVVVDALQSLPEDYWYVIVGKGDLKEELEQMDKTGRLKLLGFRIDIKELPSGAKGVTSGSTYTCGIMGGDYPKDGYWVICEGENTILGNVFTVSSPSGTQVKITYYHGTEIIKERTIKVL